MEKQLIDECFYVEKKQWGTYQSFDVDGKGIITSLTEKDCIAATRYYLKLKQENNLNQTEITYTATVDGKL
jgi:hypothetical protein